MEDTAFEILTNSYNKTLTASGWRMSPSNTLGVPDPQQRAGGSTPALQPTPIATTQRRTIPTPPAAPGLAVAQGELHLIGTVGRVPRGQPGGSRPGAGLCSPTFVVTTSGSGSSSSGVRKRMAKERNLSRGCRHVGAMLCGATRSGRERERRPPPPL